MSAQETKLQMFYGVTADGAAKLIAAGLTSPALIRAGETGELGLSQADADALAARPGPQE